MRIPRLWFSMAITVRIINTAPTTNTSDIATSTTTRPPLADIRRKPAPAPRALSLSAVINCARLACRAGASPKSSAVTNETPSVNKRTGWSIATFASSGMESGGTMARMTRKAPKASAAPRTPPNVESSTLSVSNWRMSRPRVAPSEARSAISRCLVAARESKRFETLAQAISRSMPTAPKRIQSTSRSPLGKVSLNESKPTRHFSGKAAGSRCLRSAMMGRRSVSACASVTPGFKRPSKCT